ncbi:hypothetical protein H8792_012445, partial [Thiomicrorhabdus sp. HH1]|nr:hypothetical protein [Thiomicrorhabdus heinhorstiae]
VQTMHAENKSALDQARQRDDRFERAIEEQGKAVSDLEKSLGQVALDLSRIADRGNAGR